MQCCTTSNKSGPFERVHPAFLAEETSIECHITAVVWCCICCQGTHNQDTHTVLLLAFEEVCKQLLRVVIRDGIQVGVS